MYYFCGSVTASCFSSRFFFSRFSANSLCTCPKTSMNFSLTTYSFDAVFDLQYPDSPFCLKVFIFTYKPSKQSPSIYWLTLLHSSLPLLIACSQLFQLCLHSSCVFALDDWTPLYSVSLKNLFSVYLYLPSNATVIPL